MHWAAVWLQGVKAELGDRLDVNWKYFSLEQINSKEPPEWKVWDQPEDYPSRANLAFRAAEAARRQGPKAFDRFHQALLKARHEEGRRIDERQALLDVAGEVGLDVERFARDLDDRSALQALARDHTEAVERYGVFGTPTLVFPNGQAAYMRMRPAPPPDEVMAVWDDLATTIAERPYIQEVKRPRPPKK